MKLHRSISCGRLGDLCGKVPEGHVRLVKDLKGASRFAPGQVWVERVTDRLWRVQKKVHRGKGGKRRLIALQPYPRGSQIIEVSEAWLLRHLYIWDEAVAAKERFLAQQWQEYLQGGWDPGQFPTFPRLAAFLGFDPNTGCRID